MRFIFLFLSPFLLIAQVRTVKTLQVPGRAEFCKIDTTGGYSVLPSGRRVTPAGTVVRITNDPFGLAVSPNGQHIVALHSGVLSLMPAANPSQVVRIPSYDKQIPDPFKGASFLGAVFSTDSKLVYLSGGDKGTVVVFDVEKQIKTALIN